MTINIAEAATEVHPIETTAVGKMIDSVEQLILVLVVLHHLEQERKTLITERAPLKRDLDLAPTEVPPTTAAITTDLETVETETTRDLPMTTNVGVVGSIIINRETPGVGIKEMIQEATTTEVISREVVMITSHTTVAIKESTVDLPKGETSADLLIMTTMEAADHPSSVRDLEVEKECLSEEVTVVTQEEVTKVTQTLEETMGVSIDQKALGAVTVVDLEAEEAIEEASIEVASVEEEVVTEEVSEEAVVAASVAVEEAAVMLKMMMSLNITHSIHKKPKPQLSSCNTVKVLDTIMIISSNMEKTSRQITVLKITLQINKLKAMICILC